jgi:hypothetical protein
MGPEALEHSADLPRAGVAARRLARFERELAAWLETEEGRFALWRAQRDVAAAPAPESPR